MKRTILPLAVVILLIGGGGYAWGSARTASAPPPSSKPADLPGNQPRVRAGDGPSARALGTHNTVTKREYVPLATPCRLYDSRLSGGRFASNEVRTVPLAACPAIPSYATALDASLSAVFPIHPGYLRAWAAGATEPTQTVLQWGTSSNTTGATINVAPGGVMIHSFNGPTYVTVDIAGYYAPAIYADVVPANATSFGSVYSSSDMISGYGSTTTAPGRITLVIRRDITYCDIQATAEGSDYRATAVQSTNNRVDVWVQDNAGNPARGYASVSINC
ncbi:MAG: hypothetical protein JWN46_3487 [Acidimicrobiales bacterium]|nr:hypothetical protein [Acidimicrobiales bacterium]